MLDVVEVAYLRNARLLAVVDRAAVVAAFGTGVRTTPSTRPEPLNADAATRSRIEVPWLGSRPTVWRRRIKVRREIRVRRAPPALEDTDGHARVFR